MITPKITMPSEAPTIDPRPPESDTPPITAIAMASSSYITPMPDWAVSPRAEITMPASEASIAGDHVDQHQVASRR